VSGSGSHFDLKGPFQTGNWCRHALVAACPAICLSEDVTPRTSLWMLLFLMVCDILGCLAANIGCVWLQNGQHIWHHCKPTVSAELHVPDMSLRAWKDDLDLGISVGG
jgi:hypothetical protein